MAYTVFVDKATQILASWLNPVNVTVYDALGSTVLGLKLPPTTPAEVRANLGLTDGNGATRIGTTPVGNLLGTTVQAQISELEGDKAELDSPAFTTQISINGSVITHNILHTANSWDVGQQLLEYTLATSGTSTDHGGWVAYIHDAGTNADNIVPLVGHSYHDRPFTNISGAYWGVVTEAWTNKDGGGTLVGGEFAVIQQYPTQSNPSVGSNVVFKNRLDNATHPVAPIGDGALYNRNSTAMLISSQNRPSDPTYSNVGSGWQTAIRIGDLGFGPGLDWEGGSYYPGSSTYKAYSTVLDMTNALRDLAGGFPWSFLYKNDQTYWGVRFNGTLTGALDTKNIKINAPGSGYAIGDRGTIGGGSGSAKYQVINASAGVPSEIAIVQGYAGSGYTAASGATTTATSGTGTGLTIDITIATGCFYGANLGIAAAGTGYSVGDFIAMNGGTAGYKKPTVKVTTVSAGAVTGIELQSPELIGVNSPQLYVNGRGFTTGTKTTTAITGVGTGLQISISDVTNDLLIGGEKWEFWRMLNPSSPIGSGVRHGYIDASYPGTPLTIDTSGATYTFPIDGPL